MQVKLVKKVKLQGFGHIFDIQPSKLGTLKDLEIAIASYSGLHFVKIRLDIDSDDQILDN